MTEYTKIYIQWTRPSITVVKNGGAVPLLSHTSLWHSSQLIKHRDNFIYFFFTFNSLHNVDCVKVLQDQIESPTYRSVILCHFSRSVVNQYVSITMCNF
jgi:hypothetical protein